MASMNFSTAEEIDAQKAKIRQERKRKLTDDRKPKRGDSKLAQTEGLKTIRTGGKRNQRIVIDDQVFDLKRIRNRGDLLTADEIADMEGWYED